MSHKFADIRRQFMDELVLIYDIEPSKAFDFVLRCYGRGYSDGRDDGAESERRNPHREDMGR